MKSLKYILMFLVAAVTFTACEEEWTPGEADAPQSVYFPSDVRSYTVTTEDTFVEFPVYRAVAGEALTVNLLAAATDLKAEAATQLFTLPTSVSFAAGEGESKLSVGFDPAQLERGVMYQIDLQIKDEQYKGNYGLSSLSFTIGLPEPWIDLGAGKPEGENLGIYRDNFYSDMVDGLDPGYMAFVQVLQHELKPNIIRVVDLISPSMTAAFYGDLPKWMEWTVPLDEPTYLDFDISDPENVIFAYGKLGQMPATPANFKMQINDFGMCDMYLVQVDPTVGGKFKDNTITYESAGCFWLMEIANGGYGYAVNSAGLFAVAFPGTSFIDATISASYSGMTVSADGEDAKAIIDFKLGFDVSSYKFVILDADATATVEDVVNGILDGTLEEGVYESEDGSQTSWEVPIKPGIFTVVAVPYVNGEAYPAYNERFYFPGAVVDIPEAEFVVEVGSVVGITGNPEYEENFPSNSSVAIYLEGDPYIIKTLTYWVGAQLSEDVDDATYLVNGYDAAASIENMKKEGYYDEETGRGYTIMVFTNQKPGSTIGVVVGFNTVYGMKSYRANYTIPTEAPKPETPEGGDNTEGGNTDGGNTEGGNTEGGNTEGGNTEGGNTEGGNTEGGNTEGGNTEGGNTEGGNTEGGNTEGGENTGSDDSATTSYKAVKANVTITPRVVTGVQPYYGEVVRQITPKQAQLLK